MRKIGLVLTLALMLGLGGGFAVSHAQTDAATANDTYRGDDNDTDWGWLGLLGLAGLMGLRRRETTVTRTDTARAGVGAR